MNKKLYFISILLISMALLVGATITGDSELGSFNPEEEVNGEFTINNDYGHNLTDLSFELTQMEPSIGGLEVTFLPSEIAIIPLGGSELVRFNFTIPGDQNVGDYTGIITIYENSTSLEEFVDEFEFHFTVSEEYQLSVTPQYDTIYIEQGEEGSGTIELIIKNDGTSGLTNINIDYNLEDFEDGGDNQIDLAFDSNNFDLNSGEDKTITITVEAEEEQYLGSLSGDITFTSEGGEATVSYNLEVITDTSWLDIDLGTPSNIDELEPGESFDFYVQLDNIANFDMEDVSIKVWIKDIDDGDDLEEDSNEFDLDEGDDKDVNFEFDVPYNVDEDSYDIKVRVKGEDKDDSSNDFEFVKIFKGEVEVVKEEDEAVAFDDIHFSLVGSLTCGSIFTVYTDVINIGEDDLDDMYVKLEIEELGLEYTSVTFDLEEDNYDDREYSVDFLITLPNDLTENSYTMKFYAYNEDDDLFDIKYYNFDVLSCTISIDEDAELYLGDEEDDNVIYLPTGFSVGDLISGDNAKIVFWVLVDLALLSVIVASIVWISKRKTIKKKRKR